MVGLISEEYRELNKKLHDERPDYGTSGHRYAHKIMGIAGQLSIVKSGAVSILDYGCGKGTLKESLPQFPVTNFDPCVERFRFRPVGKFDLVVCTDVMEHVEPESTPSVIRDIGAFAQHAIFLQIATQPAKKTLADGRNAHINLRTNWGWVDLFRETIGDNFSINSYERVAGADYSDAGLFLILGRKPK